jgi:hypothetical protein
MKISTIIGFAFCALLFACRHSSHNSNNNKLAIDSFKNQLVLQKIGETGYDISLPKNYTLEPFYGKDYTIYYFQPRDTTDKISLRGGIFNGNFPGLNDPDSSIFKKDSVLKSPLLGTMRTWLRFSYKTSCMVQVIVPAFKPDGEPTKMYAFGQARKADLLKLMAVFSTVKIER